MVFGRCNILEPWEEWESTIHNEEAQIDRQGWAMTYGFDFIVSRENKEAWFSSTTDVPYYRAFLDGCTCYDFQKRKLPCKHIYRLAVELGLIEIVKRPSLDKAILAEVRESGDIDNHPEQIKRQQSAKDKKCNPVEIDFEKKTAIFIGSGKNPYETTTDSCTCRDFFVRRLPCKHMYRLRQELSK